MSTKSQPAMTLSVQHAPTPRDLAGAAIIPDDLAQAQVHHECAPHKPEVLVGPHSRWQTNARCPTPTRPRPGLEPGPRCQPGVPPPPNACAFNAHAPLISQPSLARPLKPNRPEIAIVATKKARQLGGTGPCIAANGLEVWWPLCAQALFLDGVLLVKTSLNVYSRRRIAKRYSRALFRCVLCYQLRNSNVIAIREY